MCPSRLWWKSRIGIDKTDPAYYTPTHGNGQTPPPRAAAIDVGGQRLPAARRRSSVLRTIESRSPRGRCQRLRREPVRDVLGRRGGPAESGVGPLLPDAVVRLPRGPGLGTGDRVAGGRFVEPAHFHRCNSRSETAPSGSQTPVADGLGSKCRCQFVLRGPDGCSCTIASSSSAGRGAAVRRTEDDRGRRWSN